MGSNIVTLRVLTFIQDNSLREWSFKKAITIRSYSSYHPVPVPFNLVSILAMAVWRLCQCCVSERNRFDKTGLDEREMVSLINLLTDNSGTSVLFRPQSGFQWDHCLQNERGCELNVERHVCFVLVLLRSVIG